MDACPLEEVDRRLADTKRLWLKANDAYFDPDDFRIYAQNCIQALRSVTFVLQAQERVIPDFRAWYAPHQEAMKSDAVLRWLVDARNRIEKRGDLRRKSLIRASLITWYLDEFESRDIDAKLFDDLEKIFDRIPLWLLEKYVLVHGVLRIERRWVHDCLPDHEVLEALAYAFEKLQGVVAECHNYLGLKRDDDDHVEMLGDRPPEMIGREEDRTIYIDLRDGAVVETEREVKNFTPTEEDIGTFEKRFGSPSPAIPDADDLSGNAEYQFEYARRFFLEAGTLASLAIIMGKRGPTIYDMNSASRQEKLVNYRKLAVEVKKRSASSVFLIREAWTAILDRIEDYVPASEAPNREEIILLTAANDKGEVISLEAKILRDGDKVSLGPTERARFDTPFLLAEVFKVWNLPAPSSELFPTWKAASESNDPE